MLISSCVNRSLNNINIKKDKGSLNIGVNKVSAPQRADNTTLPVFNYGYGSMWNSLSLLQAGSLSNKLSFKGKSNSDIETSNRISELEKNYKKETKIFRLNNGEKAEYEIYKQNKERGNIGYPARKKGTEELYWVKMGEKVVNSELAAAKFYRLIGEKVPEITKITDESGNVGILKKFIPDYNIILHYTAGKEKLYSGIAMDLLLGNGSFLYNHNSIICNDEAIRYNLENVFGKTFFNEEGVYTNFVKEIGDITNFTGINSALEDITIDDVLNSFKKVVELKDEDITDVLDEYNLSQYKETILKRKEYLTDIYRYINYHYEKSDYTTANLLIGGENYALSNMIYNTGNEKDLNSIEEYLDSDFKSSISYLFLKEEIKQQRQLIQTKPDVLERRMTTKEFWNFIENSRIKINEDGEWEYNVPEEEIPELKKQYGEANTHYIVNALKTNYNFLNTAKKLTNLMNIGGGRYVDFWKDNFTTLLISYYLLNDSKNIIFNNIPKLEDEYADIIMSPIVKKPNPQEYDLIEELKRNSKVYNEELTSNRYSPNYIISKKNKEKINRTSEILNKYKTKAPITVYRGDTLNILNIFKTESGELLGDKIKKVMRSENPEENSKKIIEEVLNSDYVGHQERYTSCALFKDALVGSAFSKGYVIWELDVPEQTPCSFLESSNFSGSYISECELLIERGANIRLIDIYYDENNYKWLLRAKIESITPDDIIKENTRKNG